LAGWNEKREQTTISSQIEKYFLGESLADVGCGPWAWLDGQLANISRTFYSLMLLIIATMKFTLPFVEYSENEGPLLLDALSTALCLSQFCIMLTILLALLESVWASDPPKRLIVIESVFGVDASNPNSPLPGLDQAAQLSYAVVLRLVL